jgi:site-specific DNA recombinase
MNRAALYARVSTDEQAEKYGLASQLRELRALAERKAYTVPTGGDFIDDGYSGATLDRPALARLRDAIRAGAFDVLLVHDTDRLSRSLAHQLLLLEEFERARVRVDFATVTADPTPEGTMLLQMKGMIAEYERAKIRERTSRGRREKARQGLRPGSAPPYGYQLDPTLRGRLLVDEEQAAVVRMMFDWLVDKQRSVRSIAVELRRLGIRSQRGPTWAMSSVRRVLTNRAYIGEAFFNQREVVVSPRTGRKTHHRLRPSTDWIPVAMPALIAPELFARAQQQLARNRAVLVGRPSARLFLLRGLLRCEFCRSRLIGQHSHGRPIYRCNGRDRLRHPDGRRCRAATHSAKRLERFVWDTLVAILRDPGLLDAKLEAHRARIGAEEVEVRSAVDQLRRAISELGRKQQRLLDLYLEEGEGDALTTQAVKARLKVLSRQKAGLEERLASVERRATVHQAEEQHQDAIRRFCGVALRGLAKLTPPERQQLMRSLMDEIVVGANALEIQGVLPGRWAPTGNNRSQRAAGGSAGRRQDDAGATTRGGAAATRR